MKLNPMIAAATLALAAPVQAQTAPAAPAALPAQTPATLLGAIQFDLPSKVTGRTYRIFVSKPVLPPPPEGYPVVYLSDGNGLFGTAMMQATLRQFGELRPAIIVGIGYPVTDIMQTLALRNRDLTPPTPVEKIPAALLGIAGGAAGFGGAEPFYRFLVDELRPVLAVAYRTDPKDQTLFGDSLGGLFTLHVLFNHPESFRTFVAASPSIWWNDRAVLAGEAGLAAKVTAGTVAPRVLITVGGLEQPAAPPAKPDPSGTGRMVDNARAVADSLAALHGGANYMVRFHVFPDETHASVIPSAISRGLGFALAPRK